MIIKLVLTMDGFTQMTNKKHDLKHFRNCKWNKIEAVYIKYLIYK